MSGERARRTRGGWRSRVFALELAPSAEVASGTSGGCLGGDAGKSVLDTVAARELGRRISEQSGRYSNEATYLVRHLRRGGSSWKRGPNSESLGGFLELRNINYEGKARPEVSMELQGEAGKHILLDSVFFSLAEWEERFPLGDWAWCFSLAEA